MVEKHAQPEPPERGAGDAVAQTAALVRRLREPGGCPWDRQQTHASLRRFAVEEAFELVRAIEAGEDAAVADELGDLLLQVLLHSRIAQEEARFDLASVARGLAEKLVRRHPHVFGESVAEDPEAVRRIWRAAKAEEGREAGPGGQGEQTADPAAASELLPEPDPSLPALFASQGMQAAAADAGFDWRNAREALHKVAEEAGELVAARRQGRRAELQEELGDLLFMVVNIARLLDLDAEAALRQANTKFYRRFAAMERLARDEGRSFLELEVAALDRLWEQVKEEE